MTNACDLLKIGKVRLQEKGWTKGQYKNLAGEYCMLGAIGFFFGYDKDFKKRTKLSYPDQADPVIDQAANMLMDVISPGKKHRGKSVVYDWNDEPGRTLDQVFEVFDKAIELCEKE